MGNRALPTPNAREPFYLGAALVERLGCALREKSSKHCGEKLQPQINANERKCIQEKSTRITPPLGMFSGVHSKSAQSWVLGLWGPCTRRLCASSWPSADLSRAFFGSFASIRVHLRQKRRYRVSPMVGTTIPYDRLSLCLRVFPRRFKREPTPPLGGTLSRSKQVASGKIGGRGEARPFRHWCEGQASRLYSP